MTRTRGRQVAAEWVRGPADELAIAEGCWFDPDPGQYVCDFLQTFCKQSKGRKWAGQPLVLLPWQHDFLMRLFGWRRPDGLRRYRTFYLEIPKKNGKSTLISGLALYLLVADGEPGAEVYCLAYDSQQARVVFDESARMVRKSPDLSTVLDVVDSQDVILFPAADGKIQALSKEVASKDGVNASGVLFDELHRQRTREMWDIFEFSGAGRDQPVRGSITTAGDRRDSICWEQRQYSIDVNTGKVPDTTHLGIIYAADPTDDLNDPATWRKANPSMGLTINEDDFTREMAAAKRKGPLAWKSFRRLRLGIWGEAAEAYLEHAAWAKCGMPDRPEPPHGLPCFGGLDLASTEDLAAYALLIPQEHADGVILDVLLRCWLPRETAELREEQKGIPYLEWAEAGWLTLTEGARIDYDQIRDEIVALSKLWPPLKILADPWNATQLCGQLLADGLPVDFVRQQYSSISSPTKELERLITTGVIRHEDDPVLNWCVGNAVAVKDGLGNVRLDKAKSAEKIDLLVALVNAVAAYLAGGEADEFDATSAIMAL